MCPAWSNTWHRFRLVDEAHLLDSWLAGRLVVWVISVQPVMMVMDGEGA